MAIYVNIDDNRVIKKNIRFFLPTWHLISGYINYIYRNFVNTFSSGAIMTIVGSGNSMVEVAPIDTRTDNSKVDKLGNNSTILSNGKLLSGF